MPAKRITARKVIAIRVTGSSVRTGSADAGPPVFVLEQGEWNDMGRWLDSRNWKDEI